jgi:linoleoyl-CoA desaturase
MSTILFREKMQEDVFFKTLNLRVQAHLKQHQLSNYGDWAMFFKALFYVILHVSLYILVLFGDFSPLMRLICACLYGISGLLVAYNISHDACHHSLSPYKKFNRIVYFLTFNLQGTDAYLWQMRHIHSHHLFPNVDGCDADIDANAFIRLSPSHPLRSFHRYQHWYAPFFYAIYTLYWVVVKDWVYLCKRELANLHDIKHPISMILLFVANKILYFTITLFVPYWVLKISFSQILFGFVIMHVANGLFFIATLITTHFTDETDFPVRDEAGYIPRSWAGHQLATAMDYHPTNGFVNFLLGGFNAHAAHHLFPHICHIHYTKISEIIQQTAKEFKQPYHQTTFVKAIGAHFKYLKKMGNE